MFPNNKLTFNSKFFPKNNSYSSIQSSQTTAAGELTVKPDGTYTIAGIGASFNISWIIN